MSTVAVITHYNRPDVCREAIRSVREQVDLVVVVDNSDTDPLPEDEENTYKHWYRIDYDEHPCNLSRAWNLGIDWAQAEIGDEQQWEVIIMNDDAEVPPGWVDAVRSAMRQHGAAAACSGEHDVILRDPGPVPLSMRMQGWAFMLAGEKGLRIDEQFEWWFGDSDIDWQARLQGGMVMIRGFRTNNKFADGYTVGHRQVQAAADAGRFNRKWGGLRAW